jgi:hypothetical protein
LATIKTLAKIVGIMFGVFLMCSMFYSILQRSKIISGDPEWIEPLISYVLANFTHSPETTDFIATSIVVVVHLSIIAAIIFCVLLCVKLWRNNRGEI